ncbi:MAG: cation:proton antiporter [Candidatus Omnitrophica bacterium]|nr:cation:proton antiporter [Candidatus Omnitrophota bacterium]MCF7877106.1 cation:proton antiporter [Candidatus Omnitrophota bacterium]MCF7892025.1 cation:proton antiporter [Candidatus Omnitrophota bacterium]MCF7895504.1 cation:proton antiporter [Candidatus Omnitrophota bacterium]MCF7898198.1 cation:proton antiporter [Candidatus Omnitrophota bacterium]
MFNDPILSLAVIFIVGFFLSKIVSKLKVPTITTYVLLGILLSPNLLGVISPRILNASDIFSNVVLGIIAFSLGKSLSFDIFRQIGKPVIMISLTASLIPWALVAFVLWIVFNQPFTVALVFGAIAAATDPATTVAVTQEYRSKGVFTDTLLGIVAVDDLWALIIFGFSFALAQASSIQAENSFPILKELFAALIEIGGSLLIGVLVALIFNFFLRFVRNARDRLIYTLGFLFLAVGLAIFFKVSILLACMFFGAFFVNVNRANSYIFETVNDITPPLYLIFFVLAGAQLKLNVFIATIYLIGAIFVLRILGKIVGSFFGAKLTRSPVNIQKYMGMALLPQAGVALGCALVVKHHLNSSWGDLILTATVGTTVFFELLGPLTTKFSLVKAENITEEI